MSDRLESVAAGREEPTRRGFGRWINGRARRREYWTWAVPWFVGLMVLVTFAPGFEVVLGPIMFLVWIRRLHDIGWSGWIAPLINIAIAIIGWIEAGVTSAGGEPGVLQMIISMAALVVLGAIPGQRHGNRFGPPPGQRDLAETFS